MNILQVKEFYLSIEDKYQLKFAYSSLGKALEKQNRNIYNRYNSKKYAE